MEITRHNRIILTIAFLLSLLFHIGSMFYAWLQRTNDRTGIALQEKNDALQQEIQKEVQNSSDWAETKARKGNFGTPVYFDNEPETDKDERKVQVIEHVVPPQVQETQKNEVQQEQEKSSVQNKTEISHITEPLQKREIAENNHVVERHEVSQPRNQNVAKKVIQPAVRTEPQLPAPKKLPSLAQLTQGFLHHMRDEGKHSVSMLGKKNGQVTDEQLKYERYIERLNWCLQNSMNINSNKCPSWGAEDVVMHVFFALNRDGSLKQLHIAKSSGNIQLDSYALFIFKDASSSFPPVPHYLPHDPFSITCIFTFAVTDRGYARIYQR